mgnify:CR=1 FL=1
MKGEHIVKKKTENKLLKGVDKLVTYKQLIYGLIIGLIIGLFIMVITKEEQIAKLENGEEPVVTFNDKTITANDLYEDMKEYYSVGILLNTIDDMLFRDKYLDEGTVKKEVDDTISKYKEYYKDKFTTLLTQNGFTSEKSFRDYLLLDYRRNEAVNDYMKNHVTESEINKYYEDNVYGDVDTKHILVKPDTKSDMKEDEIKAKKEEANSLAKKIITELNNGKTFDEVKEEYKDSIVYEELGYRPYNDSLEKNYLEEMHKLKVNTYSKTPVETSYGYHIVYKIGEKDKPELNTVKDDVIDAIVSTKQNENTKYYQETLFTIREEAGLSFKDTNLESKYNDYKKATLN